MKFGINGPVKNAVQLEASNGHERSSISCKQSAVRMRTWKFIEEFWNVLPANSGYSLRVRCDQNMLEVEGTLATT